MRFEWLKAALLTTLCVVTQNSLAQVVQSTPVPIQVQQAPADQIIEQTIANLRILLTESPLSATRVIEILGLTQPVWEDRGAWEKTSSVVGKFPFSSAHDNPTRISAGRNDELLSVYVAFYKPTDAVSANMPFCFPTDSVLSLLVDLGFNPKSKKYGKILELEYFKPRSDGKRDVVAVLDRRDLSPCLRKFLYAVDDIDPKINLGK